MWLDAFISDRTVGVAQRLLGPADLLYIENTHVERARRAIRLGPECSNARKVKQEVLDTFLRLVRSGKRVVAMVGNKDLAKRLF